MCIPLWDWQTSWIKDFLVENNGFHTFALVDLVWWQKDLWMLCINTETFFPSFLNVFERETHETEIVKQQQKSCNWTTFDDKRELDNEKKNSIRSVSLITNHPNVFDHMVGLLLIWTKAFKSSCVSVQLNWSICNEHLSLFISRLDFQKSLQSLKFRGLGLVLFCACEHRGLIERSVSYTQYYVFVTSDSRLRD